MAQEYRFRNAGEILAELEDGNDLYNINTGEYLFLYNDIGSVASYQLSMEEAKKIAKENLEVNEYWGAFLETRGTIYDSEEHDRYTEGDTTPYMHCEDIFTQDGWYATEALEQEWCQEFEKETIEIERE